MTRVTDLLNDHRAAFEQLLDTLTVRHYIEDPNATPDGWDDVPIIEHDDSPVDVPGYIQVDGTPTVDARASGVEREGDATVFVDIDAFVTAGGKPWASSSLPNTDVVYSEVTDTDGTTYRIVSDENTKGGFRECRGKTQET